MAIHKKLLEFQKENITLLKSETNPHFRSSYVPLNEVLSKIKKPLNDAGVLILQIPEEDGLTTILRDVEDKDEVSCFMPYVNKSDPQKLLANITYNRRGSLVTLLGLEDEDDDGNTAAQMPAAKAATVPPGETTNDPAVVGLDDVSWEPEPKS